MPANMVKTPADERAWDKAKERAKEEGMEGNWAYVTSIFQKMTDRTASVQVPYAFAPVRAERGRVAFQGLSVAVTPELPSGPRGCYRGVLLLESPPQHAVSSIVASVEQALGRKPAHLVAYVGPNALAPLAVWVAGEGGERRAALLGFDSVPEALEAYAQASGAKEATYMPTTAAQVHAWVQEARGG